MTADLSRLSLNTATTRRWTLREAAEGAARAGLAAIGAWRDRVQDVGAAEAARIVADNGLRVSSLCRGGFFTASDHASIAVALDDNRRAIEEAAILGTRELILVVGGLPASRTPYTPASPYPARATDDAARNLVSTRTRVADRLADLAPFAADHRVRLVLEPMHPLFTADRGVVSTLGQALDIAEPFDPAVVGVVVDTYHVWWDPDLERQIARAGQGGRLAAYQIGDFVLPLAPEPLNSRGHVGDGFIDFATLTTWVREAGYTGDVETEIFNEAIWDAPPDATVATVAERYARYVRPYL